MKIVESEGTGSPSHGSLLKVGRLIDTYLAENAPEPYPSLQKFIAMIEILPYFIMLVSSMMGFTGRAVDIYLKVRSFIANN